MLVGCEREPNPRGNRREDASAGPRGHDGEPEGLEVPDCEGQVLLAGHRPEKLKLCGSRVLRSLPCVLRTVFRRLRRRLYMHLDCSSIVFFL